MSLVFDHVSNTPQTHVLIIGVGDYPYMNGGRSYSHGVHDLLDDLTQLSTTIESAQTFRQEVENLEASQLWIRPLGSIEFLVSDPAMDIEHAGRATRANIAKAYRDWKNRCNANQNNVAIFFFSGHGLEKDQHYLLAEDFGEDSQNVWSGAFDFDTTRRAFHQNRAEAQCFFVDACRQITSDMLLSHVAALPLENPSVFSGNCKFDLTMKAAAHNEAAHGLIDQPSFFTQALIGALKGNAARCIAQQWVIETSELASRMNQFLGLIMTTEGYKQRCISVISNPFQILKLANAPDAMLNVTCDPAPALALANLTCEDPVSGAIQSRRPLTVPWSLNVRAGIHKITASFATPSYADKVVYTMVDPPVTVEKLQCL